jgi:hypothetical protein
MVIAVTSLLHLPGGQVPVCRGQLVTVGQLVTPEQPGRVGHADRMAGGGA